MHRFLGLLAICAALLGSACSSDSADPTPTTTTSSTTSTSTSSTTVPTTVPTTTTVATTTTADLNADAPECVGDDWNVVDAGPFVFWAPADLVDQRPQGIDSLVGNHVGGGLDLWFDFGAFSPNLGDIERFGGEILPVTLGAVEAEYGSAETGGVDGQSAFITQLYAQPAGNSDSALWMGAAYDDPGLAATAECLASTVRFT